MERVHHGARSQGQQKGYVRTQTHDYIRHGTITLFAALSYLEGKVALSAAEVITT